MMQVTYVGVNLGAEMIFLCPLNEHQNQVFLLPTQFHIILRYTV